MRIKAGVNARNPSAAKAGIKNALCIAAVNRCATQNHRLLDRSFSVALPQIFKRVKPRLAPKKRARTWGTCRLVQRGDVASLVAAADFEASCACVGVLIADFFATAFAGFAGAAFCFSLFSCAIFFLLYSCTMRATYARVSRKGGTPRYCSTRCGPAL